MWSNQMSIDKVYQKELDYIFHRLQNTKEVSYAVEESKNRVFVYLASVCENRQIVEDILNDMMFDLYLSFFKLRYFQDKLGINNVSYSKCALLSALTHFDREFEKSIVSKAISECVDYNVDGLYHFRLRALQDGWKDVVEVASRLVVDVAQEEDMFDIASFITGSEGKKSQLVLRKGELYSITKKKSVGIAKVFDNEEYNLLFALIKERPNEIVIENSVLSKQMQDTMRHIARVVEK